MRPIWRRWAEHNNKPKPMTVHAVDLDKDAKWEMSLCGGGTPGGEGWGILARGDDPLCKHCLKLSQVKPRESTPEQVQNQVLSLVLQMVQEGCSGGWLTERLPYFNLEAQGLACNLSTVLQEIKDDC